MKTGSRKTNAAPSTFRLCSVDWNRSNKNKNSDNGNIKKGRDNKKRTRSRNHAISTHPHPKQNRTQIPRPLNLIMHIYNSLVAFLAEHPRSQDTLRRMTKIFSQMSLILSIQRAPELAKDRRSDWQKCKYVLEKASWLIDRPEIKVHILIFYISLICFLLPHIRCFGCRF